ncbi:ELP2 (YGR200C) [Zygosaccharomyces parabailii]|nr:ELP2 (YGR200C) [Zygosaccharomyces parabailii]CDH09380.1 probable Elongator complex protein 2 [Zygosaccharomyces bailii ISA1307]
MSNMILEATFIGANRQNQVSDVNKTATVAFGAGKTIALWDPICEIPRGVYATLKGHNSEVTCVKFIPNTDFMVSASEDHHVKIWEFSSLECVQTIEHYRHSIVSLAVWEKMIVVGSADGLISLWVLEDGQFILNYEFSICKGFLPLSLSVINIQDDGFLLAVGGTKTKVFIYSFVLSGTRIENFQSAAELEGHEDWIKSLAFRYKDSPGECLLATGSQDRYIRLWKVRLNELIDDSDENVRKPRLLSNKQYKFKIKSELRVSINFEALIVGHDDWISSLQWHENRLQLLASTADTSLMVWEPDESSGVWICGSRLGEISSKGASTATGSSGGFWSCLWFVHEDQDYILTNGKSGSWRVWSSTDHYVWEQRLGITGATKQVTDVAWSPRGDYLLSTSSDQTTRLYAPWQFNANGETRSQVTWHEFSRPQIHGYDMVCVESISSSRFVSGAEEKVLRSFDLPKGVSEILQRLSGCKFELANDLPVAASLPALGLSNKATSVEDNEIEEQEQEQDPNLRETNETRNISYEMTSSLTTPPFEDQLQRHLLWPEIEKLYGHGYEISCVDVSPDSKLIASACRSNNAQHAGIRIFDTSNWLERRPTLLFHTLTITRLKFSDDNKYLLSVSRDRQWGIWERDFENQTFNLIHKNAKAHTRIIWDCDWAPSEYGQTFFTASRDKTVKAWSYDAIPSTFVVENTVKFTLPVTAISVYKKVHNDKLIVAVGLEDGSMYMYKYSPAGFELMEQLNGNITPADKITRMRCSHSQRNEKLYLAVSSCDNSTRIYSL